MITRLFGYLRSRQVLRSLPFSVRLLCILISSVSLISAYNNVTAAPEVPFNATTLPSHYNGDIPKKRKTTLSEFEFSIIRRNLFGATHPEPTAKDNSLPLRLIATCWGDHCKNINGEKMSLAVIEDTRSNIQDLFSKDEDVFSVAKLTAVYETHIEVTHNGFKYVIYLGDYIPREINGKNERIIEESPRHKKTDPRIKEVSFRNYEVGRSLVEEVIGNLTKHLSSGYSRIHDGGILIYGLSRNSIFRDLGIIDSDTVTSVNGVTLTSFLEAASLFQKLKNSSENSFTITIVRAGITIPLRYTIVD